MEYSSILFIYGFLPLSLVIYYLAPRKLKDAVLLLLSVVFVGLFGLRYLAFLGAYTVINYASARMTFALGKKNSRYKIIPFAAGMLFDVVAIFVFRMEYFSWISRKLRFPDAFFPVGISLFTLSAVGYLLDVYSGRLKADKNFIRFALYIMMIPRLLMGPVVRYDVFRRILKERRTGLQELGIGLTVFIKGLAKKVIAADTLYNLCTAVRASDVSELSAVTAWLGAVAYILCLYFTLSGVADMGVGIGHCFGLRFPQSFNYPMFRSRIKYFAAKWHVQVVHWFRRYVTRPLSSRTNNRYARKLIFIGAWTLVGFWYGFGLGGAVWGALMGAAIILENRLSGLKMLKATGIIYTFVLTTVFAVFLSSDSIGYSFEYLLAMIGANRFLADGLTLYLLRSYLVVLLMTMYASTDLFRNMMIRSGRTRFSAVMAAATPVVVTLVLAVCTALMAYSGGSKMILFVL